MSKKLEHMIPTLDDFYKDHEIISLIRFITDGLWKIHESWIQGDTSLHVTDAGLKDFCNTNATYELALKYRSDKIFNERRNIILFYYSLIYYVRAGATVSVFHDKYQKSKLTKYLSEQITQLKVREMVSPELLQSIKHYFSTSKDSYYGPLGCEHSHFKVTCNVGEIMKAGLALKLGSLENIDVIKVNNSIEKIKVTFDIPIVFARNLKSATNIGGVTGNAAISTDPFVIIKISYTFTHNGIDEKKSNFARFKRELNINLQYNPPALQYKSIFPELVVVHKKTQTKKNKKKKIG